MVVGLRVGNKVCILTTLDSLRVGENSIKRFYRQYRLPREYFLITSDLVSTTNPFPDFSSPVQGSMNFVGLQDKSWRSLQSRGKRFILQVFGIKLEPTADSRERVHIVGLRGKRLEPTAGSRETVHTVGLRDKGWSPLQTRGKRFILQVFGIKAGDLCRFEVKYLSSLSSTFSIYHREASSRSREGV